MYVPILETMDALLMKSGTENLSSLDADSGLGLEIRMRQLGKLAGGVTNMDFRLQRNGKYSTAAESSEGVSVVGPFLARICPVIRDEIIKEVDALGRWRATNLAKICQLAAKSLLKELSQMHLATHPRVMDALIKKGSLTESPVMIKMWANYLVSSCTFDQDDERFISYSRFLENISPGQARLLELLAETVDEQTSDKQVQQHFGQFVLRTLAGLAEANDREDLQLDLDNLQSLHLIEIRPQQDVNQVSMRLTKLGSQFYQITHKQ